MKYLDYAKTFNASDEIQYWISHNLINHLKNNPEVQDEIEHIIDYLIAENSPRLIGMSYDEAKSNADKWLKIQQKKGMDIDEKTEDTKVVLDFKDGFKIVQLIGENAYKREGFLMSNCVASYYGNGKEIYSLRDKNNMPHCTIEKDKQIKGKGNGDIHPNYIDYIIKFLEWTGMKVRDSEMVHLGYDVVNFGKYSKTKLYRDRYAVKGTPIEYQDGVRFFDNKSLLLKYSGDDICLFKGDLIIEEKEKLKYKYLAGVSDSVYVREGATFTAPKLASSGSVYVREGATFTAPKLATSGSVEVRDGATFTAPKLASSGYVYVREGATFTAPKLATSGSVDKKYFR